MNLSEVLPVHMGVYLCGGDVGVAEKLLNSSQICAPLEEMRGEAVAECVG